MEETVQGYIPLHFRAFKEEGQWVGTCLELGTSTCADTEKEVAEGIIEATTLYIETLQDEGELDRVLAAKGLEIQFGPTPQYWEEPIPVRIAI